MVYKCPGGTSVIRSPMPRSSQKIGAVPTLESLVSAVNRYPNILIATATTMGEIWSIDFADCALMALMKYIVQNIPREVNDKTGFVFVWTERRYKIS